MEPDVVDLAAEIDPAVDNATPIAPAVRLATGDNTSFSDKAPPSTQETVVSTQPTIGDKPAGDNATSNKPTGDDVASDKPTGDNAASTSKAPAPTKARFVDRPMTTSGDKPTPK